MKVTDVFLMVLGQRRSSVAQRNQRKVLKLHRKYLVVLTLLFGLFTGNNTEKQRIFPILSFRDVGIGKQNQKRNTLILTLETTQNRQNFSYTN